VPSDAFPHRSAAGLLYDGGNYGQALERALEVADYRGLRAMEARERAKGRLIGIGLCAFVEERRRSEGP
jgi:carbon-monoxide dehydrogenase large subunit